MKASVLDYIDTVDRGGLTMADYENYDVGQYPHAVQTYEVEGYDVWDEVELTEAELKVLRKIWGLSITPVRRHLAKVELREIEAVPTSMITNALKDIYIGAVRDQMEESTSVFAKLLEEAR